MEFKLYKPRIVDGELTRRLKATGATLIEGPRYCGKTASAEQVCRSAVYLDAEPNLRALAEADPAMVLDGEVPRLLDEWQLVPELWNVVRREVDRRRRPGQFVLTGSAVPADDVARHSGAGRFTRLRMRPMSLFEKGFSTGEVSLKGLLAGEPARAAETDGGLRDLVRELIAGGWPALLGSDLGSAMLANRGYIEDVARVDISRVDLVRRDPVRVARLLTSLARNTATLVSNATLAADAGGDAPLSKDTVADYLGALSRLMVVEEQPAWSTHLRSRAALISSPKRHFVDPSLAVAALNAGEERLLADVEYLGQLFESLVVRDLRIYGQAVNAQVSHFRDENGREIDAIVETAGEGEWAAFEVKLGQRAIDEAAANLRAFAQRIDTSRRSGPAALAVIVPSGYAYMRKDGVAVVPIKTLGP